MVDRDDEPVEPDEPDEAAEHPATWENVVVGRVKKFAGELFHKKDLVEEGEDQAEIAHEVQEEEGQQQD